MLADAEKGCVSNIVFGYDKTIGDYFNLSINENKEKAIQKIFQWYIEDGYGLRRLRICLMNEISRLKGLMKRTGRERKQIHMESGHNPSEYFIQCKKVF